MPHRNTTGVGQAVRRDKDDESYPHDLTCNKPVRQMEAHLRWPSTCNQDEGLRAVKGPHAGYAALDGSQPHAALGS
jgi:hypothetical protein